MTKYFYYVCVLAAVLWSAGCDEGTPADALNSVQPSRLYGAWQWTKTQGGIGGFTETPHSTGRVQAVVFRAGGVAQFYRNDTLVDQRGFTITQEQSYGVTENILHFYGTPNYRDQKIELLRNDSLIICDRGSDAFYSYYVRVK